MGHCISRHGIIMSRTTFNNYAHLLKPLNEETTPKDTISALPLRNVTQTFQFLKEPCIMKSPPLNSPASPSSSKNASSALPKVTSERLDNPCRRRLSVSTILQENNNNDLDASINEQSEPLSNEYPNIERPILESFIVNKNELALKKINCSMIYNYLSKNKTKPLAPYMIFGAAANHIQRSFDNKRREIFGTPTKELKFGYVCKKGLKPESPNQDDFFIIQTDDWSLYAVFDGHGPHGHDASLLAHKILPFLILTHQSFTTDPILTIKESFKKTDHILETLTRSTTSCHLDCSLSGTTATIILVRDSKIYIAHVGDSRSVLGFRRGNKIRAIDLTIDHKPARRSEKARIEASGGEVKKLEGDIPYRVFVKNRLYPGLAMSRALGDSIGSTIGIISDPDIYILDHITDQHEFIILATDGIWEFITSQEAVDIISYKASNEIQQATENLAYEAWKRWLKEEKNVVDDITCITIWLLRQKQ